MKFFLNTIFFFIVLGAFAQDKPVTIEIPPLNTGNYGDELKRSITAGDNGALIRFVDKDFGNALWNQDSLIGYILDHYSLDSTATASTIAFSVGDFIKYGGFEQNIQGYGLLANVVDDKGQGAFNLNSFSSFINFPTAGDIDFCNYFSALGSETAKQLGVDFKSSIIELNGYATSEYFDADLDKWVIIFTNPKTKVFLPKVAGKVMSIEELMANPALILKDEQLAKKNDNVQDRELSLLYYEELKNKLEGLEEVNRTILEDLELSFDYYLRLLPNQSLEWAYTVDALFLDYNKCNKEFVASLEKFQSGDSTTIVDALIKYSKCYGYDWEYIVPRIAGEKPLYADATFFGKDLIRANYFATTLPKGEYTTEDIYLPHLLKRVEGEINLNSERTLKNFELNLFDFSDADEPMERKLPVRQLQYLGDKFEVVTEKATIEFYSNDRLNFVVNEASKVAVLEGDVTVKQFVNGKESVVLSSKKD